MGEGGGMRWCVEGAGFTRVNVLHRGEGRGEREGRVRWGPEGAEVRLGK